ncbi:hypothetical protein ACO0SA_002730 [Hanseniaspora valbyensis]
MESNSNINYEFSDLTIPFYTNLTSIFSRSIYTFDSMESMALFKDNKNKMDKRASLNKLPSGQILGVPLFQCQLKKDASYLMSKDHNNLIIYKYIIIPSDEKDENRQLLMDKYLKDREYKLVCENIFYNISIYKIVYSEIKNKKDVFSLYKERKYCLKFRNDSITMHYYILNDSVKVESSYFDNSKWIYNNNFNNALINGIFLNNNYKLVLNDNRIICEFDDSNRSNKWTTSTIDEHMGVLRFSNYIKPPAFSPNDIQVYHDNEFLSDFNEKIICMTFVLITHQKFNYKNSLAPGGVFVINNNTSATGPNNTFIFL